MRNKTALFSSALSLFLILLAVPQQANAYVDPGTGAMLWQVAAAAVIGSLFYVKRVFGWLKSGLGLRSQMAMGFAFATAWLAVVTPLTMMFFQGHPLPRFNDLFLIGIVLTAYFFRWEPAAYLLAVSLVVSAWVLPPAGSLRVIGFSEWYRLLSFAVVSIFLLFLVSRGKFRRQAEESRSRSYGMHGAAIGAD
jgi:hypothetical protein